MTAVSEALENKNPGQRAIPSFELRGWVIWSIAALFYGYQFLLRVSPTVMAEDLMRHFSVDACTLGLLTSAYYAAYSFLQVPAGNLMDKFGPRRMLMTAIPLCAVGCFLFAFAPTIGLSAVGRFLIGAGSAFGFLSCFKSGTLWFPPHRLPMVVGLTLAFGTAGALGGGPPLSLLVTMSGWQTSMIVLALMGLALMFLVLFGMKDHPEHMKGSKQLLGQTTEMPTQAPILQSLLSIITKRQTWIIALYGSMLYLPLSGFADAWGVLYFKQAYGIDKTTAAAIVSTMYVGLGIGAPLYPWLCERVKSYKSSLMITSLVPTILFAFMVYGPPLPVWALFALLFMAGMALSGQFLAFPIVRDINPSHISATAGGFHNMMCMISGFIFQPLMGWLLDYAWSGAMSNGAPLYGVTEFQVAFLTIPAATLLGLFLVPFVRETYPRG